MAFLITKPIADHKAESIVSINTQAGDKILALYPLYKQLNVARLSDATAMYTYIDAIRDLSNTATIAIGLAVDMLGIRAIESQFIADLQNV
jgi:hypothetical protein